MSPSVTPGILVTEDLVTTADGMLRTIEHYDRATFIHLEAVGELSEKLALEMGLTPMQAGVAKLVGRLHDMGKVAISRDILLKPGPLTDDEWAEIRMHPVIGYDILAKAETHNGIFGMLRLAKLARAHHERMDGAGYPDRLYGYEIPIESRLVAVTDAFHAMTVGRPYCRTKTPGEAIAELHRCAGTQFDHDIVEVFTMMLGRSRSIQQLSA